MEIPGTWTDVVVRVVWTLRSGYNCCEIRVCADLGDFGRENFSANHQQTLNLSQLKVESFQELLDEQGLCLL
jgi:hypothetical protein